MALVQDTFTRANTTASTTIMGTGVGWGSAASDGNTWTKGGTATPNFQIAGNQGKITNTNANVFCLLSATSYGNVNGLVRVSTNSTNAANFQGLIARYTSGANSYRCFLVGGNTLQINKGATSLGTYSFTWSANTEYWIRFQVLGSTLTAKVWADGSSEPTSWQLTVTDATLTSGQVGIYSSPDVAATTASFDSFLVNYATVTKTLQSRIRLAVQETETLVTRFLLRVQNTKTLQARTKLAVKNTKTLQVRLGLSASGATVTKWLQTRFRLAVQSTKTLQARLRLAVQQTKTLSVRTLLSVQNTKSLQTRTRLAVKNTRTLQARFNLALPTIHSLTVTIAGVQVSILEKSLKISNKVNQRSTCSFVVLDSTGTAIYKKGQPVIISDSVLGTLFSGYVNKPKATNKYPQPHNTWAIDCVDMIWLADKRTSSSLYTNQYAGTIVCDQIQNILSAEGVWANFALDYNHQLTDWSAGGATLTNVVATTNNGDGNPGDGDLELALAGTAVTFQQQTQTDFNAGTTGLGLTSPASGGVTFTPTQAIKFDADMTVPGAGNAYTYVKIWNGSYTIAASDILYYDIWIADSCPANAQMAGIDFVCTDGTTFRDSTAVNGVDLQGIGMHPNNDLTGLATNQWYSRRFFIDGGGTWAGKTIQYVTVVFEGDKTGDYTAYFRNVWIKNGASTKVTFFGSNATSTQTTPQQMQDNGYSDMTCTVVTSYERHGAMYSPAFSLAGASLAQSSYLDWLWTPPIDPITKSASTKFTFTITASIDGFATFQPCTQNGAIPGLLPGQNLTGKSVQFVYVFDNAGNDPTLTPLLSWMKGSVSPAYSCTKSDSITTKTSNADWNGGTLTNLVASSGALQLNGYARNWDDANYSNQTQYGTGASQGILNRAFYLQNSTSTDVKSRFDFAGSSWQNFTMECDVYVTTSGNIGFVYRTTGWQNNNDTYAYSVSVQPTSISLDRGTNSSSGAGSRTNIANVALTLSSGNWHRLKIIVNGNNHQVYLNDVLYINANDSTYTAAGYVGLRFFNNTSTLQQAQFDNFGIVAALSGTWVSPAIDISSLSTISNSEIAIQIDPAVNLTLCTFLVEISLNNGTSWTTCVNSAIAGYYYTNPVPGLTNGTNVSGMNHVKIRLTITSTTASTGSAMPDLTAVTLTVLGAYNATGTWISPALSLARVANAATSLVNWNAVLPNSNTTLVVKTSINGGSTYQTVAAVGNAIPNIALQPSPWVDTFATNDSASYTQTYMTGGAAGTWTWDTTNLRLIGTSGTNAVLEYTALSFADGYVECDMDYANISGPILRMTSASSFYFLKISDDQGTNPQTIQLFKNIGGGAQIGSTVPVVFKRGTYHRIHFEIVGTAITVKFDGTTVISATDSSIAGPGSAGLIENGYGRFYSLRVQPYGQNVSSLSVLTKLILTSTDPTQTPQVLDVATLVADPTIGPGVLVANGQYQGTYVSSNIDDCNKKSNYWWKIFSNKQLIFQAQNATPAPWILQSSDANTTNILVAGLNVEYSGDLYRNRMVLQNANATSTQPQAFTGDGKSRTWTLTYPIATGTVPTITVNGAAQTVGIKGIDTGKAFYYQAGSMSITQDSSQALLQEVDSLVVTYTGAYLTDVTRNNTGGFPGTTSQSQYAAIDGTSGIVECVVDLSQDIATANMTVADAQVYGDSLLQRYGVIGRTATFQTLLTGLAIGQQLPVFIGAFSMNNVQTLVSQVDITEKITMINGVATVQYWYAVTAVEGPALDSWEKVFGSLLN